ncbi:MAG: hypothetical protein KKB59_19025 [Spirochaetes bacterium]|nr:hypothetical protein [Spirochaetota bacterium]
MGRTELVRLSKEEYDALKTAKNMAKQYGVSTFSETAQKTIKNGAMGCFIHLGAQLIIEHFQKHFPET